MKSYRDETLAELLQIGIIAFLILLGLTLAIVKYNRMNPTAEVHTKEVKRIPRESRYTYGIDVSHYQGEINWKKVRLDMDSIRFVYLKATEGESVTDPMYKTYIKDIKKENLLVGSYHFFTPYVKSQLQFNNFKRVVNKKEQSLVPMVDVEHRGPLRIDRFHATLKNLLRLLEKEYGKKPIIYTGQKFYNKYLKNKYKDYYFCIARYNTIEPEEGWFIWQFTDKGKIQGIKSFVDLNVIKIDNDIIKLKLR